MAPQAQSLISDPRVLGNIQTNESFCYSLYPKSRSHYDSIGLGFEQKIYVTPPGFKRTKF